VSHHKIKPAAMWRDQTKFCHIIHLREGNKIVEDIFLHLFDLVVVNAYILHNKSSNKNMSLEISYENVAKLLLASDGRKIQVQGQTSSPAGRIVGRDDSVYSIPAAHAKLEGKVSSPFS
jgi:hypothetical protein